MFDILFFNLNLISVKNHYLSINNHSRQCYFSLSDFKSEINIVSIILFHFYWGGNIYQYHLFSLSHLLSLPPFLRQN